MTSKEKAKKLHEIADALEEWGKYNEKVTNAAEWDTPEAKQIIRKAMTLLVDNLALLNECKNKYGLHELLKQCFTNIEQAASWPKTKDLGDCHGWRQDFTKRPLWDGEKRSFADECVRYANEVDREIERDTKRELVNATKPTATTGYESYIRLFKENKVISIIIVFAIIIIAFGSFTDALEKIRDFWFKPNSSPKQETENTLHKPIVVASATVEVKITSDWDFNGRVPNTKAHLAFVKVDKPLLITSSIGYTASQTGNDEVVYKAKLDMDAKDSAVGNPASFLKDAEYIQIEFGRMPSDSYVLGGDVIFIINNSVRLEFSIPPQKLVNNRIFIRNLSESLQVLNEPDN